MKKVNLFLIPIAITAFAITSCGNKEISKEEAGNVVKKAAAKEVPEYTTITLTTELVKYKFDIKGEGLEGLGISQEDFDASIKEMGFKELKPGSKFETSITFSEAKEQYRFANLDEVLKELDATAANNSKIKYYAVGDGVKVEYSNSVESKIDTEGYKMSTSVSGNASITLNEYALATEIYTESIESAATTIGDKSSSIYCEFGVRMSLSFK